MGIEAFLIASSLDGVLAQRLVRRICTHCRTEKEVAPAVRDKLAALGEDTLRSRFHQGVGCEECGETGYRGRIGIFELLPIDAPLRDLILQKRSTEEIKKVAHKRMTTLFQDAVGKATEGVTTLEEVLRVAAVDLLE
jgi:type IV pilus assembly protein PilB